MSQASKIDFATFCYANDGHRLHKPGHLQRMVDSNNYTFNKIYIAHQLCNPDDFDNSYFCDYQGAKIHIIVIELLDPILRAFSISTEGQYISKTDFSHIWKHHIVNHLAVIRKTTADYIVFADNDCWMVDQPKVGWQKDDGSFEYAYTESWIDRGIELLMRSDCFIVSPNDGEPERKTRRMSQQMFMARVEDFRWANFDQPGWDGNVNVPGGPMPEYWGMLEGRMELHCRITGQYRYVLGPEYRYFHHNRLTEDDYFETDYKKLGWR